MKWGMNFTPEIREIIKIEIDEKSIQSGDLFTIMRMDGIDQMIMFGTGSHSGLTAMALRFDGELYIVESQDAWYWPIKGIQRNNFKKYRKQLNDTVMKRGKKEKDYKWQNHENEKITVLI